MPGRCSVETNLYHGWPLECSWEGGVQPPGLQGKDRKGLWEELK